MKTVCLLVVELLVAGTLWASTPNLGWSANYAVLGGSAVTCTGASIVGNIGIAPGIAWTNTGCLIAGNRPPSTFDPDAASARADFLLAYNLLLQSPVCTPLSGSLAGWFLLPGVYCVDAVAKTGTLTLTGPLDGIWIFLINGALTGTNFNVVMNGCAQPNNVFWVPRAAATMTTSVFQGTILAGDGTGGSITFTGGTLIGRALANVAVTITTTSVVGPNNPSYAACVLPPANF